MNIPDGIRNCLECRPVTPAEGTIPEPGKPGSFTEGSPAIWSGKYADLERSFPVLAGFVSADERARAAAYRRSADARQFMLRRGMLRAVLAEYTGLDPNGIQFMEGEYGRPDLVHAGEAGDIHFSLSRTDDAVCVGVARGSPIGLDIVTCDPSYPAMAAAEYLFTPGERQWIREAIPADQYLRFFRIWALKEALLKAVGGTAAMMRDEDVAGILRASPLQGCYSLVLAGRGTQAFIQESGCFGHHQVVACLLD